MIDFRIRNSMLNDWDEMCGLAFRARWFGTPEEKQLFDISHKEAIMWGSYFEQLVLGSGVGGKIVDIAEMGRINKKDYFKSVFYKRVKTQAEIARQFIFGFLKEKGYPFWKAQVQLITDFEIDGMIIPYEGNADALLGEPFKPTLVLDTKFTGDTTNTWGKYAWGKPEQMDMGQLAGYSKAIQQIYGTNPTAMYYVADSKEEERVEPINVVFSNDYIDSYMWRLKTTYVDIKQSLAFNYWPVKNSYNACSQCPLKNNCPSAIRIPEVKEIHK